MCSNMRAYFAYARKLRYALHVDEEKWLVINEHARLPKDKRLIHTQNRKNAENCQWNAWNYNIYYICSQFK